MNVGHRRSALGVLPLFVSMTFMFTLLPLASASAPSIEPAPFLCADLSGNGGLYTYTLSLSANYLFAIYGSVTLSGGDAQQHAWWKMEAFDFGGSSIGAVSMNMWDWVAGLPVRQMLYVVTGPQSGSLTLTIVNTDPMSQRYCFNLQAFALMTKYYESSGSSTEEQRNIGAWSTYCTANLALPSSRLVTVWARVDTIGGDSEQHFNVQLYRTDIAGTQLATSRNAKYREGPTQLSTITSGSYSVKLCVDNYDSSSQTYTLKIAYRSIQGTVTTNYAYRGGGRLSVGANTDASKTIFTGSAGVLYIGYVRLNLYGGDQVQNVNWEGIFYYSNTAQSIVNWWNNDYSGDTDAYFLPSSASFYLLIHNRDSAAQTFQWYAEVVRV